MISCNPCVPLFFQESRKIQQEPSRQWCELCNPRSTRMTIPLVSRGPSNPNTFWMPLVYITSARTWRSQVDTAQSSCPLQTIPPYLASNCFYLLRSKIVHSLWRFLIFHTVKTARKLTTFFGGVQLVRGSTFSDITGKKILKKMLHVNCANSTKAGGFESEQAPPDITLRS